MPPTLISVRQSKPQSLKKAVVRNWCETMQASSDLPDYVAQVSQVRNSDARLKFRHIFKDNRSALLLRHTAATTCLVTERQMTQHSSRSTRRQSGVPHSRLFI